MYDDMELLWDYLQLSISYVEIISLCSHNYQGDFYSDAERKANGFFMKTYNYIKNADEEKFKKLPRFTIPVFNALFHLLEPKLTKYSYRPAIEPECRLAITLMYLAHEDSRNTLSLTFRTCPSSMHNIIYETCNIIWQELSSIYVTPPSTKELEETAKDFYHMTGLPNCVGAIDGKHINIVCPPGAGSEYFNYKGHHSIVLMAACNANYLFSFVDIGARGSESDGGVFSSSLFGESLIKNEVNLPHDALLPGSDIVFPFFFVADAAFPLRFNIMKPYPGKLLPEAETLYNHKISSARRVIENCFGIMCARWRILYHTMHCHPKNALKIVKAAVVLHNFVKKNDISYCPSDFVDHEENGNIVLGAWRKEVTPLPSHRFVSVNNARREAFLLRDKLKTYFFNSPQRT